MVFRPSALPMSHSHYHIHCHRLSRIIDVYLNHTASPPFPGDARAMLRDAASGVRWPMAIPCRIRFLPSLARGAFAFFPRSLARRGAANRRRRRCRLRRADCGADALQARGNTHSRSCPISNRIQSPLNLVACNEAEAEAKAEAMGVAAQCGAARRQKQSCHGGFGLPLVSTAGVMERGPALGLGMGLKSTGLRLLWLLFHLTTCCVAAARCRESSPQGNSAAATPLL